MLLRFNYLLLYYYCARNFYTLTSGAMLSWPTFAWLIVDADGLGLVLAILPLNAYKVGVRSLVEACPEGQYVLIGLVYSFYELYMKQQCRVIEDDDQM